MTHELKIGTFGTHARSAEPWDRWEEVAPRAVETGRPLRGPTRHEGDLRRFHHRGVPRVRASLAVVGVREAENCRGRPDVAALGLARVPAAGLRSVRSASSAKRGLALVAEAHPGVAAIARGGSERRPGWGGPARGERLRRGRRRRRRQRARCWKVYLTRSGRCRSTTEVRLRFGRPQVAGWMDKRRREPRAGGILERSRTQS